MVLFTAHSFNSSYHLFEGLFCPNVWLQYFLISFINNEALNHLILSVVAVVPSPEWDKTLFTEQ